MAVPSSHTIHNLENVASWIEQAHLAPQCCNASILLLALLFIVPLVVSYIARLQVRRGMEDFGDEGEASGEFDDGGPNDVRLPYIACGCGAQPALWCLCAAQFNG